MKYVLGAAHPGSATSPPSRPLANWHCCARNAHMGALMTQPVHADGNNLITIRRVPLHKTRSLRRLISDNGRSVEELRSLAASSSSSSSGAPQSSPAAQLPVERLTNFMDVCALHTQSVTIQAPQRSHHLCPIACRYSRAVRDGSLLQDKSTA